MRRNRRNLKAKRRRYKKAKRTGRKLKSKRRRYKKA